MRYRKLRFVLVLPLFLTASAQALAQASVGVVTEDLEADERAVIAFLPPSMKNLQDQEANEAQELVRSAIGVTKLCLGEDYATYRVALAGRIVVRRAGREETFEVGDFAPLVGALLLRPGSNARVLFAGGGPGALAQMLRSSASEYFGKACESG
jgi:hypothetical protein